MEEKERRSRIRATQIAELNRILKEMVRWKDVMTPELIRAINGKKQEFLDALLAFIEARGRVPDEVVNRESRLILPGHRGHPSPLITGALLSIDWEKVAREELQSLIDTPVETGNHFTYFLADWAKKNA